MFDRKLRLLVMDAIERIEISVRAALSNAIAARHGAHWYLNPQLFNPGFGHARFVEDIKQQIGHAPANNKRRDIYIEHYYQTYSTPDMPPSWMVFESITFGIISIAYQNLAHPEFVSVCGSYGLPHPVLISWLHSLNYIRNICAHHARLWNRECRIKPMIARAFKADLTPNARVYAQLVVMQIMLTKIAPGNHWAKKLRDLLAEHPAIPLIRSVWESQPIGHYGKSGVWPREPGLREGQGSELIAHKSAASRRARPHCRPRAPPGYLNKEIASLVPARQAGRLIGDDQR